MREARRRQGGLPGIAHLLPLKEAWKLNIDGGKLRFSVRDLERSGDTIFILENKGHYAHEPSQGIPGGDLHRGTCTSGATSLTPQAPTERDIERLKHLLRFSRY